MKVRSFFQPKVVFVRPWATLRQAASLMKEGGFSCLPVLLESELAGIITERDLVQAIAQGEDMSTRTVFDYMSEKPTTLSPEDDAAEAATQMLSVGCRHLPVVEDGKLVGIVSARDLLIFVATPARV